MNNKPIIISDLGGVIYSFSKTFNPEEHEGKFVAALKWYSENKPKYKNVLAEYNNGNLHLALDIEKEAVIKGLNKKDDAKGALAIYFSSQATQELLENAKKFKIAIVATSRKETSLAIINEAFQKIGQAREDAEKIVSEFDIYDMSEFGSKKDSNAWKQIFKNYPNIIGIVEDSEKNLNAAFQATSELGTIPNRSQSMMVF